MDYEDKNSSVGSNGSSIGGDRDATGSVFKFRNYEPQTHFIDGLFSVEKSQPETIKHLIQDKLELSSTEKTGYRIDPSLLDPKKVDWDLKQRIERRMEMLERDTRKSIAKHIKDTKRKK